MAVWSDLRYAVRTLARAPGFTAVAVLTLALGIGANTAIFSIVNAALIRPLEYPEPNRIVTLWGSNPALSIGLDLLPMTAKHWDAWRRRNHVFEEVAAFDSKELHLTGSGAPEHFDAARVTAGFFSVFGVKPYLGRTFVPEEDRAGGGKAAVVSYALWQNRFGGDPGLIGRTLTLSGQGYRVIGVLPPGFGFPKGAEVPSYYHFGARTDLWISASLTQHEIDNGSLGFTVVARLKPGIPVKQAQAEMSLIMRQLAREDPNNNKGFSVRVIPLRETIVSGLRPALLAIMAAVAAVLLIACANLANLLLTRAVSRRKEIALRAALGAGRWQLIRQLLAESLLLSLTGGVLGLLLARWGVVLVERMMPAGLPRVGDAQLDSAVVAFSLLVSVLTGVLFGLAPAWNAAKLDLNRSLKEGGRSSTTQAHPLVRRGLVVSEIAMAMVLVVTAGLLLKSFLKLQSVDTGFHPENLIAVDLSLPGAGYFERGSGRYDQPGRRAEFVALVTERASAVPGVSSVAAISELPLSGRVSMEGLRFEGRPVPDMSQPPVADSRSATPGYLRTMGVRLLKGRWFTEQDRADSVPVAVIDDTMARVYWPGEDPIGKRFRNLNSANPWWTIVGVARSVTHSGLGAKKNPEYFRPFSQQEVSWMTVVVRSAIDPSALLAALRKEIWAVDKDLPVSDITTVTQLVSDAAAAPRFRSLLIGVFGAFALLLASLGIYGVISYTVAQQMHDLGIRVALGAGTRDILRLIVGGGLALAATGVAAGLVGAFGLTRLLASLLYGVTPTDAWTFGGVAVLLLAVALVASYIPARRAMRVDPLVALRYE